jgi:hypothetical protein
MMRVALIVTCLLVALLLGGMAWTYGIWSGAEYGKSPTFNRHDGGAVICVLLCIVVAFLAGVGAG